MTKNTKYALEMRAALIHQLSMMPPHEAARHLRRMRFFNRQIMKRNVAERKHKRHVRMIACGYITGGYIPNLWEVINTQPKGEVS